MKKFTLKDSREILLTLDKNPEYHQIIAKDGIDHHDIGYLVFKHKQGGKAILCSIKVIDNAYLQYGVGSIMLQCFESYCHSKRLEYIEGRYYPEGDGAEYAKDFYNKHHYSICQDGYEQYIFKPLYMYPRVDGYDILEGKENKTDSYNDGM